MKTVGVICEYNPLHNGHARQLQLIRQSCADAAVVGTTFKENGELRRRVDAARVSAFMDEVRALRREL